MLILSLEFNKFEVREAITTSDMLTKVEIDLTEGTYLEIRDGYKFSYKKKGSIVSKLLIGLVLSATVMGAVLLIK